MIQYADPQNTAGLRQPFCHKDILLTGRRITAGVVVDEGYRRRTATHRRGKRLSGMNDAGGKITHGGNPILRWMAGNVVAEIDAAENIKPSKKKATEKIDGIVALIMGLDRCIRHEMTGSVYDDPDHGLLVF